MIMPKPTILALVTLVFFLGALYWVNEERISALEEQGRLLEELSTQTVLFLPWINVVLPTTLLLKLQLVVKN